MKKINILLATLLCAAFCPAFAGAPVVEIWKGVKMPGTATDQPEKRGGDPQKDNHGYQFVSVPTLEVFPAETGKPSGALIICPGGGYGHLAYGKEGTQVAKFLSSNGITCFVLKYRIPQNRDGAFQDAQRAVRLVRKNAGRWNVDPAKIGIMGFSAGGHLSARTSTNGSEESYQPLDAADKVSPRPDFTVLIYPAYIGDNNTYELKPEIRVDEHTPRAFIVQTQDDTSYIGSSIGYYLALKKLNIPADLHLYAAGGHGYGLLEKSKPVSSWGGLLVDWLKFNKFADQ